MILYHTRRLPVAKAKVAVTISSELLEELDELVARKEFPNRSQAIEAAVAEKLIRLAGTRLARESAKLDAAQEHEFAEEGMESELGTWPAY